MRIISGGPTQRFLQSPVLSSHFSPIHTLVFIRPALISDVTPLIELERTSPTAAHWTEQQYAQLFETIENRPERLVLVITSSEQAAEQSTTEPQILGFLVARHVASEWELENIVIASRAQRKGLGTQLLQALLDHAKRADSDSIFLEVRESNAGARALYESTRFLQTGRRQSYYANPSEDAILYRYDLS
jgi:ribosomal-protein-alanine acetyltransferase